MTATVSPARFASNVALACLGAAPVWLLVLALGMRLAGRESSGMPGHAGGVATLVRWWATFGAPVFLVGGLLYEGAMAALGRSRGESRRTALGLGPLLLAVALLAVGSSAAAGRLTWSATAWGIFVVAGVAAVLVHVLLLRRPLRPAR